MRSLFLFSSFSSKVPPRHGRLPNFHHSTKRNKGIRTNRYERQRRGERSTGESCAGNDPAMGGGIHAERKEEKDRKPSWLAHTDIEPTTYVNHACTAYPQHRCFSSSKKTRFPFLLKKWFITSEDILILFSPEIWARPLIVPFRHWNKCMFVLQLTTLWTRLQGETPKSLSFRTKNENGGKMKKEPPERERASKRGISTLTILSAMIYEAWIGF